MPAVATQLVTLDEFLAMPDPTDGSRLELVRGEVVKMPPPQGRHGIICMRLARWVGGHIDDNDLGWGACNDTGVVLETDPDTMRSSDIGFWSKESHPHEPENYFECPPDLAIEVLSPSDRRGAVRRKIQQYIDADVRLVWLVDPEARTITVYEGNMKGIELGEDETLDGGDVLPGFKAKIATLLK